jgi:hypothetical protein
MTIKVVVSGIDQVRDRLARVALAPGGALDAAAVDLERLVEQGAGTHRKYSRTGFLVLSIFKRRIPGGWQIGHDGQLAPYARWVVEGAKPHVIRPRNKKALRWPIPGGFRFAKKVRHPGYKGDNYVKRAAAEAPRIFEQHLRRLLAQGS